MLTYSLQHSPNVKNINKDYNLIYSDNRIHFKFKDYDRAMIIQGFEPKLNYLISYITFTKFNTKMSVNRVLDELTVYLAEKGLLSNIKLKLNVQNVQGFKPLLNGSKNKNRYPFGKISIDCFPKFNVEDPIEYFSKIFGIDITTYLFNDSYQINIYKLKELNSYDKFIDKEERRTIKINNKNNYVKLW